MTWHNNCKDFNSCIEASAKDIAFNDTIFLLTQPDADNTAGDEVSANKAILALISPVFYAQFYGPLSTTNDAPIEIVDGTAQGFKQLINFICNPKSFKLQVQDVAEVFNISYFAHKYQIGSLVSLCRQFLAVYSVEGIVLDTLNWAVSSESGLEMKEAFPAEHALLVNNCFEFIDSKFEDIFLNGKINDGQDLPDEDLMIKILRTRTRFVGQELVLSVLMDYYCKKMKNQVTVKDQNIIDEKEWAKKLDKIISVVQLKRIRPYNLAAIYEKFFGTIPDKVIGQITKEICSTWKNTRDFRYCDMNSYMGPEAVFRFTDIGNALFNADDWIHDHNLSSGVEIKFKTNQNAVLRLDFSEVLMCLCDDNDCCGDHSIMFLNDDYKEEVTRTRKRLKSLDFVEEEDYCYFYVKENKVATLTYERKCKKEKCALHFVKMNEFHLSKENFEADILEVNGQPVTSPCYAFIENLCFIPM